MKLGFGPNVSVVSAFFGYLALGIVFKDYNRWENNMVQTAGTAAAQTAFMCVLLAAFDMLAASPTANFHVTLTPMHAFWWLASGGLLGVLLAIPMRQHFVVDERLPFPDGTAAGTTLMVLDAGDAGARRAARMLAIGAIASAALMLMTEDARVLAWFPSVTAMGTAALMTTGVGVNWSLLSLGSGMIIGLRVDVSMLLGATLSWVVAPYALLHYGIIVPGFNRNDVLFWIMWPATGMLVAAGLATLVIRWGVLKKTFSNLSGASAERGAVPMSWVGIGVFITSVAVIAIMKAIFGVAIWITALSIILSVPLMLVGLRVLGETNWGPISALSNLMQGIFGVLVPGNIAVNMVASGNTGIIASDSEALMQDYRAGFMIGSTPRNMAIMQLIATPVGAAAVAWMYPLLRSTYGIVGNNAGPQLAHVAPLGGVRRDSFARHERAAARGGDRAGDRLARRHPACGHRGARHQVAAVTHRGGDRHARTVRGGARDVLWRRGEQDLAPPRRAHARAVLHSARVRAHRRRSDRGGGDPPARCGGARALMTELG